MSLSDGNAAWRWWVFIIFVVLFPIVLRPWWIAVISIAAFGLFAFLLPPKKPKSK